MKKKKYIVNGQVYEIPDEESGAFLKDFPEAKVQYDVQGKIYEIPHKEADAFETDMGLKKKPSSNVGSTPSDNGVSGSQATDPKLQEYLNARAEQRKTAVNDAYTSVEMPKAKSFSTAYEKPVKEAKITEQFSVNKESAESQKANNEAVRKQALATTAKRSGRKEEDVQKDVDEGKLVLSNDGRGNKIYARQPGVGESFLKGLVNAKRSVADAALIATLKLTGTPQDLANYYEMINRRKMAESEKEYGLSDISTGMPLGTQFTDSFTPSTGLPTAAPTELGTLSEMAGGLVPDVTLAAATGGMGTAAKTAILGSKMYASSYGNKAYELYEQGKKEALRSGMNENDASIFAADAATKNAALAAVPDAALNTLFFSGKLHSPTANNFVSIMKGVMKDAVKVGGLGAVTSGATSAIESAEGYDVNNIISKAFDQGGEFAKIDLLFAALRNLKRLPKAAQSAVKEFAVDPLVKPIVEKYFNDTNVGIEVMKELDNYEAATKDVRGIVPEEKMVSIGGRMNKRQNRINDIDVIKNEITELEAKKKGVPESLHETIDEAIKEREIEMKNIEKDMEGIDREIEQISKSKGTGLEKEKDEATGEPIISKGELEKISEPIELSAEVGELTPKKEIITPKGFTNRVFDKNTQLGKPPKEAHISEEGYNYRVLSKSEIDAISESGGVFAREGKQKGGNSNTKYWTKGNGENWYGDKEGQETIRVKQEKFSPDKVVRAEDVEVYNKQTKEFEPLIKEQIATQESNVPVSEIKIESETTSESPIESVEFIPTEEAKPTEAEPIKAGEGAGGEPPKEEGKVTEEGGDAGKEFDEMMKELPNDTGDVKKYLSGKTINKFTSRETENDQTYREDKLIESAQHGQDLINKAKEVYGDEYVEKTLEYLEEKNVPTDVKAVALVSLENEMEARVSADPKNIGLHKLQDLVREKSQAFLHKASIAINAGRFRKLKEIGFDLTKYTDEFFTSKEKENKQKVEKLIEANADTIQKEYEAGFEEKVQEAAEKLRKEERVTERKENREKVHKKIDEFTSKWIKKLTPKDDSGKGINIKKQGAGAEEVFKSIGATMKAAYDAGEAISKVVKDAVDYISEKLGHREWGITEFVSDAEKMLTGSMKEDKPNVYVKQALIDAGFGKKTKIKGEEVKILDWKKLAGEEGSISKISAAVAKALEKDGYSEVKLKEISQDFIDEYIKIRQRVIENGLNEIARLNKQSITPEQKSAAKRLSELYNYGLFDKKNMAEFEVVLNKALGISELTGKRIKRVEEIAKAMSMAMSSEYQGKKVEQYQIRAAEQHIQELIRDEIVDELSVESIRKEGKIDKSKVAYKIADVIGSYMDLSQMMLLNSVKNAVLENPISGYMENVFNKAANRGAATKDVRKRMTNLGGAVLKEMITEKGAPYGDVTSTFVTRSSIERDLGKESDNRAYQATLSTITGKTLLSGVDSYYKANNVQRNFLYNMQKVLTQDRKINGEVVKGMTKDEARNYIAERMSKQSYEEAKKTARDIIEKVNKEAGRKILNDSELFVERMANDIVKGSLVTGGQITPDMVTGSYDAAYEAAGRGLGHVANNYLSRMIGSETGRIESKIKQSVKEKDFANAAFYRMYGILFKNILNPYVGGGTNWAFLTLERGGAGLVTGLGSMIKDRKARKMDLTTDAGIKDMKRALYANQKIRDKFIRGAVGGSVGLLTALIWGQIRNKEEYEKWRKNNEWATKYTDILYPQVDQYFDAEQRGELPRQVEKNLNLSTQFDKGEIAWQAFKYAVKGESEKAAGKVGQLNPFGAPIPWRLVRDVDQIVTGISGGEPYRIKTDVPETFWQGYWKGGLVDYMGFAPHSENYGGNKKSSSGMPQKPQKPKKKEKKQFAN